MKIENLLTDDQLEAFQWGLEHQQYKAPACYVRRLAFLVKEYGGLLCSAAEIERDLFPDWRQTYDTLADAVRARLKHDDDTIVGLAQIIGRENL